MKASRSLSPREREVVERMSHGMTQKEIAKEIHISPKTVAAFMSRICEKLGAKSNKELAYMLAKNGGSKVIARVWNVNEGLDLQPCWAPVTENAPKTFKTYLVVENENL